MFHTAWNAPAVLGLNLNHVLANGKPDPATDQVPCLFMGERMQRQAAALFKPEIGKKRFVAIDQGLQTYAL